MSLVAFRSQVATMAPMKLLGAGLLVSCIAGNLSIGAAIGQNRPAAAAPKPERVQPLSRASFIATMNDEYLKLDVNKDGTVTKAELEADRVRQAAAAAAARARARFSRFDTDRNGQLSADEFIRATAGQPKKADLAPLMSRLDKNRDDKVSAAEYRALTLVGFDKLDTDNDGVLSEAEQRAASSVR